MKLNKSETKDPIILYIPLNPWFLEAQRDHVDQQYPAKQQPIIKNVNTKYCVNDNLFRFRLQALKKPNKVFLKIHFRPFCTWFLVHTYSKHRHRNISTQVSEHSFAVRHKLILQERMGRHLRKTSG